jgi:GNAT superfamily N-acetyltransferase
LPKNTLEYSYLTEASAAAVDELNALVAQMSRKPREMDLTYLERILASPAKLIVARDGAKIIACAQVDILVLPSKIKGWVEDVVVDESYRGQGVAKRLMEMAIEYARKTGCKHLNLTSGEDRGSAQTFYQGLGFYRRQSAVYRLDLE